MGASSLGYRVEMTSRKGPWGQAVRELLGPSHVGRRPRGGRGWKGGSRFRSPAPCEVVSGPGGTRRRERRRGQIRGGGGGIPVFAFGRLLDVFTALGVETLAACVPGAASDLPLERPEVGSRGCLSPSTWCFGNACCDEEGVGGAGDLPTAESRVDGRFRLFVRHPPSDPCLFVIGDALRRSARTRPCWRSKGLERRRR